MCPACLTSVVLIAAGSGVSGGLAVALAGSRWRIAAAKALATGEPTGPLVGTATRDIGEIGPTPTNGGRDTR
jgi:hypothetical protein